MKLIKQTCYEVSLKLKSPSELALRTNLYDHKEDVIEAVEFFNRRFKGIKQIILLEVGISLIDLILIFNVKPVSKVTAKELTVFSRYLYHDKGWSDFSKEPSKLLIPAKEITELYDEEVIFELQERNISFEDFGIEPYDFDDYEYEGIDAIDDINEREEGDVSVALNDTQMLMLMNSIVATQQLGDSDAVRRKKEVIAKIKKLLYPWAIK